MLKPLKQQILASAASLARLLVRALRGLLVTVLMGSLQAYKLLISPLLGNRCRFHPTCSCYAQQSIERFGPLLGTWLSIKRLLRCGPWHPGGIDEVPEQCSQRSHLSLFSNAVNRNRA